MCKLLRLCVFGMRVFARVDRNDALGVTQPQAT
jgi:hypothetical protein